MTTTSEANGGVTLRMHRGGGGGGTGNTAHPGTSGCNNTAAKSNSNTRYLKRGPGEDFVLLVLLPRQSTPTIFAPKSFFFRKILWKLSETIIFSIAWPLRRTWYIIHHTSHVNTFGLFWPLKECSQAKYIYRVLGIFPYFFAAATLQPRRSRLKTAAPPSRSRTRRSSPTRPRRRPPPIP